MSVEQIGGFGITGHYGKGGSGKSRDILETDIIPALKKGRKVITNLPLLIDGIMTYFQGIDYRNIEIVSHEEMIAKMVARQARGKDDPGEFAHALIFWDEIQDVFPAGFKRRGKGAEAEKFDFERDAFIGFLAWSRHDDCEFIWATQHYSSVDVELRRKTHIYVQHEHLFHLGMSKRWAARTQLPDSMTGDPNPDVGSSRIFGPNPVIFRCYKSAEVGNHKGSSRQRMMIPKKIFIVSIAALIALGYTIYSVMKTGNPLDPDGMQKNIENKQAVTTIIPINDSKNPKEKQITKTEVYNDRPNQVQSIICVYSVCHGIDYGIIVHRSRMEIIESIDTITPKLRAGNISGNISRMGNGNGANLPGL